MDISFVRNKTFCIHGAGGSLQLSESYVNSIVIILLPHAFL